MRAHQIMTRPVFTILPEATILEAANLMLERHISEILEPQPNPSRSLKAVALTAVCGRGRGEPVNDVVPSFHRNHRAEVVIEKVAVVGLGMMILAVPSAAERGSHFASPHRRSKFRQLLARSSPLWRWVASLVCGVNRYLAVRGWAST